MNKLFDICMEIDKEFSSQTEELNNKKLKKLHEEMKKNGISIYLKEENGHVASSEYTFAISFLDSLRSSLYLCNEYMSYKILD